MRLTTKRRQGCRASASPELCRASAGPERQGRKRRRRGFTLIEIMLVIAILTILLAIAWPNWTKARDTASNRTCLANLRQIEIAKEQFIIEYKKTTGDAVGMDDLAPAYLRERPSCPYSGEYTPEPVGTKPACTIAGHQLP